MFITDPSSAILGKEILPFEYSKVSEYFLKKAAAELNETPERRIQGLKQLKEMIKNEKTMKDIIFQDDFLIQYLRAKKYNAAKAFSQLKSFVTLKRKNPQMFSNFRFENIVVTMKKKIVTVLPWRCQDGCAIILIQLDNWNPEEFSVEDVKRMAVIYLLQSLRNQLTQINGFKAIFDVQSNPLRHLRHATPQNLYLIVHGTQDCVGGRYKGVHIVNDSLTFKAAWAIAKYFVPEKLKRRIFFHSSHETLLNHFPREVLPIKYGGTLENYDMSDWLRKVMQPEELEIMVGGKYPDYHSHVRK